MKSPIAPIEVREGRPAPDEQCGRRTAFLLVALAVLGVAYLAVVLLQTWHWSKRHVEETAIREARLGVALENALRSYVAAHIRPEFEKRAAPGEFVPEAMSSSFIARSVFETLHEAYPDYVARFPSTNPRNLLNRASEEEEAIIRFFEDRPDASMWSGRVEYQGRTYVACAIPRRFTAECMRCHGRPEDAPASLLSRYGRTSGFGRSVGEVSLDLVAVPTTPSELAAGSQLWRHLWAACGVCGLFLGGVVALIVLDIRQRRRHQEAIWESNARTQAITTAARDAIVMMDPCGRISFWNPAAEAIFGHTKAEALGRNLHELLAPERYLAAQREGFAEFARTGRGAAVGKTLELFGRRKDGQEICVAMSLSAVKIRGDWHAIGILRDETDRKRAEAALLMNQEDLKNYSVALESANKALEEFYAIAETATRAKSEFLANMSHEIRTPITAILGYAEIMVEENHGRATQAHALVIKRNGEHLLGLVNDILDLSKVEAGKLEIEAASCSPSHVLAEVVSLMRMRAEAKGLTLRTNAKGLVPESILTDPLRLRQILVNLLGNAIKFSDRGVIQVTVELACQNGLPKLRFDVEDAGIGMHEGQIAKLFQPFSQVDASSSRRYGGTGLGLAISKRLAKALGGDIEVRSTPGRGSTFSLTIDCGPLEGIRMIDPAEAATLPPAFCSAAAVPGKTKLQSRVLLAEDGPDNRRLIRHLLEKAGADVTAVENGQLAVEATLDARQSGRPFDVILMDMQMPVTDGYAATRQLREAGYAGPIVALTAHAMADDRRLCLEAGCDDYASKPIDRQRLLEMVARWTARASIAAGEP